MSHAHTHTHAHTYNAHMHAHTHAHTHTHTCTHAHRCASEQRPLPAPAPPSQRCTQTNTRIHIQGWTRMRARTHTHTHTQARDAHLLLQLLHRDIVHVQHAICQLQRTVGPLGHGNRAPSCPKPSLPLAAPNPCRGCRGPARPPLGCLWHGRLSSQRQRIGRRQGRGNRRHHACVHVLVALVGEVMVI